MGYQMTTCHEADTTFSRRNGQRMPGCLTGCLTAWLYSISIGACFKSIFIIIFISFFFSFFYFSYFFPPLVLLHLLLALVLFVHSALSSHHAGSLSAAFVAQCSTVLLYYVGDAACPAKSGTVLKAAIKVGMR